MADDIKLGIDVAVQTSGDELIDALSRKLDAFNRKLRAINAAMANAARGISSPGGTSTSTPTTDAKAAKDAASLDRQAVASLRQRMTMQSRMASQQAHQERQAFASFRARSAFENRAAADEIRNLKAKGAADIKAFRDRMRFTQQAIRLAASEERNAARERQRATSDAAKAESKRIRESASAVRNATRLELAESRRAERERQTSLRDQIAGHRYNLALRQRMERDEQRTSQRSRRDVMRYGSDAGRHGQDAYQRLTRPGAIAGAAGAAGAVAGTKRVLAAESDIDAAEINARIYANLSKDAARDLRDKWAAPLAEQLGVSTAKLLTSYTDAVKLGIPAEGAKQFSELATQTSEAWGVPFEGVTDILGTVNTLLTSTGEALSFDKIKGTANALQYLAAKQSTTPEKLMSFLQRGAGAAQVLGMSQEAGLAFGSASTSLGNQAGQSGRMFDYVASRLIEMPRLTKKHGDEGKQSRDMLRLLGYGSASEMDQQRRQSPDDFLPDFMKRFNNISDPKKREQAIRFFAGREWMGEFGRIVVGIETYKESVKLSKEAKGLDAIGEVWQLHKTKLAFVFKQFKAGWLNILGEFGKVLSSMARQAGDYFLEWSRKLQGGGLRARFSAALQGLIEGFGFADLTAMMEGLLGKPGEGDAGAISQWKATGKAFAEGIRDVASSFKAVIGAFVGGDPEIIARWTGRILALSVALAALSPVLAILGGLTSVISALAASVAGIAALKGLSAGAVGGAAVWSVAGGLIGAAFLATIANRLGILKAPDTAKGFGRGIVEFLDPGLASRLYGDDTGAKPGKGAWIDPPARKSVDDLKESIDANSLIHKQSFERETGLKGLIHRASLDTSSPAQGVRAGIEAMGGRISNASVGSVPSPLSGSTAGGGFSPSPLAGSIPGSALGSGGGRLSSRGIIGGSSGYGNIGAGPSRPAKGALATNQQEAYKSALGEGLSPKAARALVANMSGESLANPKDHHWDRSHMSQGIVQWDPQRAEAIRQKFGKLPKDMTVSEQTRAAIWEIRNKKAYAATNRALQGDDHREMIGALVGNYERPQNVGKAVSERLGHYNGFNPNGGGASGAGIPGLGGADQYDGLRMKGQQAIAGGQSFQGVTDLARQVQASLPGGVKHFSAFNDRYHQGTGSKHASGLAFDTTLIDAARSSEAAEAIRNKIRAAGIRDDAFKVIDEYRNPSARSTSGHIHSQFNTADAAKRYSDYIASLKAGAGGDVAAKAGEIKSSGWRPGLGGNTPVAAPLGEGVPVSNRTMSPPSSSQSMGGSNGGGGGAAPVIHINGTGMDHEAIANAVQRKLSNDMGRRTHDVSTLI